MLQPQVTYSHCSTGFCRNAGDFLSYFAGFEDDFLLTCSWCEHRRHSSLPAAYVHTDSEMTCLCAMRISEQIRLKMFGEMCVFTGMGLGSKDTTTPAISVILCNPKKSMSYQPKKKKPMQEFCRIPKVKKCKKKDDGIKIFQRNPCVQILYVCFFSLPQECSVPPRHDPLRRRQRQGQSGTPTAHKIAHQTHDQLMDKVSGKKWHRNARCAEFRNVFYLPRHDFCVDPADVDAGKQAGLVVGINDVAPVRFIGSRRTVVRTLSHHFRCSRFSAEDVNHFHYVFKKID